ncbi:hypothetical protein [Aerococcus viridans]
MPIKVYVHYMDQLPERFHKRASHYYTEQAHVLKGENYGGKMILKNSVN